MNRLSAFIGASGGLVPIQHGLHALFGGRAANCDQQNQSVQSPDGDSS